ncbi:MAG: S8 family serine peptidase [Candidatus Uhrbacteria bacterium]|nr:S8 family serine peptidase [Candidatus Uhrbacteria bacterium]
MRRIRYVLVIFFVLCVGGGTPSSFFVYAQGTQDVIPADPLFSRQTYLQQIHAPEAWALTTGSTQVVVAVLDSGMDIAHPDLRENVWSNPDEIPGDGIDNDGDGYIDDINGWDFINDIPDPSPKFGGDFLVAGIQHGTLLAGIIAARGNNGLGVAGISWRSKIMPLRVLNNQGDGDVFTVVRAIDYAIGKKVDIINLSFVGDSDSSFLRAAIKRATDAGIIVVAATGNDQADGHGVDLSQHPVYPACYDFSDNVISVGSTDSLGQKTPFSSYGPCIDIMAPGTDIFSTQVVKYERTGFDVFYGGGWSGSSLSTAMVSGVLALVKSVNPSLTPSQASALLRKNCDNITVLNPFYPDALGCGELNVYKVVKAAIEFSQQENSYGKNSSEGAPMIGITATQGNASLSFFTSRGKDATPAREFFPYAPYRVPYSFVGSPRDGFRIFGAGPGGGPHVRVFDRAGNLVSQFFAYDRRFRGGVMTAIGDVDGDGHEEIVTTPASRGGAHVMIFSLSGELKKSFFAYDKKMRGGYAVALGDLNNDGKDEIVLSPLDVAGFGGDIRVFNDDGVQRSQFYSYGKKFTHDISLVVGDVDGDGTEEIVTAPRTGRGELKIFSSLGVLRKSLYPYGSAYDRGISLAIGNPDGGREQQILAVPRARAPAHVMIIDGSGAIIGTFFASAPQSRAGYTIGIIY